MWAPAQGRKCYCFYVPQEIGGLFLSHSGVSACGRASPLPNAIQAGKEGSGSLPTQLTLSLTRGGRSERGWCSVQRWPST